MSQDAANAKLTDEQKHVLLDKGTEAPFSGALLKNNDSGTYHCAACGALVFKSDDKYDSTTPGLLGWPSFAEAANSEAIKLVDDTSYAMQRVEVQCATCGGHLGHLFDDTSAPTGQHYCINSVSLDFKPKP